MADVIQMMTAPVVVSSTGGTKYMPVDQAIDVSGYDKIDFAIDTLGSGPLSVHILTSMALHSSDSDWVTVGSLAPVPSLPDNTANQTLTVPNTTTNKPLLRYIRWQIVPHTSTGAVNITGLARRG